MFTDLIMDAKLQLEIVGLVKESCFHVAKSIAEGLKQKFPEAFLEPKFQPLLELDWTTYLCSKKMELRGEVWEYSSSLMCFLNSQLLGTETDLTRWARVKWDFTLTQLQEPQVELAEDGYKKHLLETGHRFVFMDVEIGGEAAGKLLFELFSDVCPKTSENFEALCTGERGSSPSGLTLCYQGSLFHRIVPNGWLQGGDISSERKGDGGESIFGSNFEDESFAISHSKRGILGMANKGPHTNGSQFYITLQPTPWMDKSYVAFGQVVEGVDVLRKLENVPTCVERPKRDCKITACGVFTT